MKDIELAKEYLKKDGIVIAAIKDGKLIFKSKEKGIKPMYILATEMMENMNNASIADKVIGKGAAMLCKHMGVKYVYGQLMSINAIEFLEQTDIEYTYKKSCSNIENRERTGLCPIEKLSKDIEDGEALIQRIEMFLKGL